MKDKVITDFKNKRKIIYRKKIDDYFILEYDLENNVEFSKLK
jgi:hypothetical protein